jgi:hypothetical protein
LEKLDATLASSRPPRRRWQAWTTTEPALAGLPTDDAWAIAVGAVCTAISAGDQPQTFVAHRLLDAAKRQLQRAVKTEVAWNDQTHEIPALADRTRVDEPSAALILNTAVQAGVINPSDAALIHTTTIAGHSLAFAASQLGISYETAKKRRQRAGHCLAAWWAPEHLEPSSARTRRAS